MKRVQKELYLSNITNIFSSFSVIILVNFSKITASNFFNLRRKLKSVNCGLIVIKNSLASIAFNKIGNLDFLHEKLHGSIFVAYSNDISLLSKVLIEFLNKNKDKTNMICSTSSGTLLDAKYISFFAKLPNVSLEEIKARLICSIFCNIIYKLALRLKAAEKDSE